jgi:transcriptional regulator with XRE-family HTH domain
VLCQAVNRAKYGARRLSRKKKKMPFHGKRLAKVRESRGLTQQELADLAQMSKSQLGRYETNKSDPSADAISRIAKALGISSDYLLGLSDSPTAQSSGFTPEETTFMGRFRKLPQNIRDLIISLVFKD